LKQSEFSAKRRQARQKFLRCGILSFCAESGDRPAPIQKTALPQFCDTLLGRGGNKMRKPDVSPDGWKRLILLSVALACLSQVGLAQKVTVEFDQAANFSQYKTFAIRNGQLNSRNAALNSPLVKKQIEADIERGLAAKGLEPATGRPDLNVVYHFGQARKIEVESYPAGWRGWGTRVVKVPYAEGTLVIDLRDTSEHSLVWRGIASEEKSYPAKIQGKLDDMVKKALDKYPPKQK
jgi:hypothetical protein